MNKRLHTLLTVLAEIVVIVAIVAAIPKLLSWVLGTPYPLATITSSSMWPALKRGDMVLIRGCPEDRLESGMIIVYRSSQGDEMIIHRIEEIDGGEIVTKGDANAEA
ncbi:MAG: signal peptidase I, partial [Coriobacteriia bacterium]|nr:signal peptidase I [Coriobacteriia bacterium]